MTRTGAEQPKPFRPGLHGSAPGGDPSRRRVQGVSDLPHGTAVRDSKNPSEGHLSFPAAEWDAFLSVARR